MKYEVLGIKMKMKLMNLTCKLPNFQLENCNRIPNPKAIYNLQEAESDVRFTFAPSVVGINRSTSSLDRDPRQT